MKGKSPMMKALIGKQNNLPAELKAKILASPATMKKESMATMKKESMAKMKKAPAKMKKESMTKMKKESSMKMMDKKSPAKKSVRQQQIEGTYVEKKDRPKKVVVKKPKGVSVRKQQILDAEKKRLSNRKGDNKYKENVEKVLKSQNRTLTPKKEKEKQVKVNRVKIKEVDIENNSKIKTPTNTPPKSKNDIKKEKRLARNERQKARVKDLKYRLLGKAGRAKMEAKGYVPKKKKK